MTTSADDAPGRIFLSYRRGDSAYPASWLFDQLASHFRRDEVFKDVDSIPLGDDFVEVINTAVGSCDVLLALIGQRWLAITDEDGRRRLDNPDDFVRLEIEAALARNIRIIPILVEGTRMPDAGELPASLANLARRQAFELSPNQFDADTERLLRALDQVIAQAQEQARQKAERTARMPSTPGDGYEGTSSLDVGAPAIDVPTPDDDLYQMVAEEADNLVVFLSATANSDDRDGPYRPGMLPDDKNLADYLAVRAGATAGRWDLAAAAEYVRTIHGDPALFRWVRRVFPVDAEPASVHRYLARLPSRLEQLGFKKRYPMIVTSQLDVTLERAFLEQQEPFDVAIYMAPRTEYAGKFVHLQWGHPDPRPIEKPMEYVDFPIVYADSPEADYPELTRTVIVRTKGAIEAPELGYRWRDNIVITEDDVDLIGGGWAAEQVVPVQILAKLREASGLFLGYAISDRQHRAFLRWVWGRELSGDMRYWAVERNPSRFEQQLCRRAGVSLYRSSLTDYVSGLDEFLRGHRPQ